MGAPPIKSPFVPLRHPPGAVDYDQLNQNFDRISKAMAGLFAKLQVNYVALPSGSTPPGADGARTFPLGASILGDQSGAEKVVMQWRVQTGPPGADLTIALVSDFRSASGTAVYRLRIGGGDRTATGTVVLATSQTATGTAFVDQGVTATIPSPGGRQRMKLTVQSSANGSAFLAQIKDGYISLSN